jgi:acetyltransferase-like isoleucine patch superfamily enzyme
MQPVEGDSSRAVYVHPNGLCESESVGSGTRVWAFAHVLRGAVIGRDCNICDGVYIEGGARVGDRVTVKNQVLIFDGVIVEDDVFLGPGVVFTNDLRPRAHIKRTGVSLLGTTVRRGATLGAGVTVVCGTMIGHDAFVGAGAVIVDDVPAHAFMLGNPARRIGWVCTCGERLPDDLVCAECGRRFQLDIGMPPEGGRPVLAAKPVCLSEIDPGSARANGPIGSERKT